MILFGLVAAVGAAGALCGSAYLIADRLVPAADVVTRLVVTVVTAYWLAALAFQSLALLGWFSLPVVVLVAAVVPVIALIIKRRSITAAARRLTTELAAEGAALRAELGRHRWIAIALMLVGGHLAVRMARSLATPAFGWDDFTYHLYRAGRWVQSGGIVLEPAPDAWTYYEFFPWGGDLLWAWAMIWGAGDTLIPVVAIVLWSTIPLAVYAATRELGAERLVALIVAVAVAVLPSQAGQLSTAYVDNAVLLMVVAASLFLLRILTDSPGQDSWPWALLLGASLGLGLLVKISFLPFVIPAAAIVLASGARSRSLAGPLALVVGGLVAAPNLVFNAWHRDSPFYPFELLPFLPYNAQHSWILSKYGEGATAEELWRAAKALVVNLFPLDPFLNLGLVGLALLLFGLIGARSQLGSARGRWFLVWVATGAALTLASFFSPRNSSMVAWWTLMMGRFLVPGLAGLFLLAARSPSALVRWLLVPLLLGEYFFYSRRGWPIEQTVATVQAAALMGLALVVGWILLRRLRKSFAWPALVLACALILVGLVEVRERYRYDAYRLFAARRLLDFHGAPPVEAWPIWERLDELGPQRVAATAGFDGLTGHNWFRGPLLGPFLENEVVYLPVTRDGQLLSYRDREELVKRADRGSWLERLRKRSIDRVVALGPANIEHRWLLELPEIFEIEISMGYDHFLLARVDQAALADHLKRLDSVDQR